MIIHIHNTNIFNDPKIDIMLVFSRDSLIWYLIVSYQYQIISYHIFVSVQQSRPCLYQTNLFLLLMNVELFFFSNT
jgi:hypothetical protein